MYFQDDWSVLTDAYRMLINLNQSMGRAWLLARRACEGERCFRRGLKPGKISLGNKGKKLLISTLKQQENGLSIMLAHLFECVYSRDTSRQKKWTNGC